MVTFFLKSSKSIVCNQRKTEKHNFSKITSITPRHSKHFHKKPVKQNLLKKMYIKTKYKQKSETTN